MNRIFAASVLLLALAFAGAGQTKSPTVPASLDGAFLAGGISYNPGGGAAGTALYAQPINSAGTYPFAVFDVVPQSLRPFSVNKNASVGLAQRVLTVSGVGVYIPTAAGISFSGSSTGWSWSSGVLVRIPSKYFDICPNLRVVKSSVAGQAGYQPIAGILFSPHFGK